MQEVKYYTPEIEEFCVGFKYEVLEKALPYNTNFMYLMPPLQEDTWFEFEFPDPYVGWNVPKILQKEVRVKYLDKEDIESLTFVFYKELSINYMGETCYAFHSEELNLMLGFYPKNGIISLATKDPSKNKIFLDTSTDPNRINRIKIKNISEFKKLLKQLDTDIIN